MKRAALKEKTPDVAKAPAPFKPKRGRPTQSQVAAIDKEILSVACAEFLGNGYVNTSMDAVASLAGISKGTLYARYRSKDELFDAIVVDRLAAWRSDPGDPSIDSDEGVSGLLYRTGMAFLRKLREPEVSAFHRLIMAEAPRFPELARQFYEVGMHGAVNRLAQTLETDGEAKGAALQSGRSLALAFITALIGWYDSESMRHQLNDDDCGTHVSRLVSIFTNGRQVW